MIEIDVVKISGVEEFRRMEKEDVEIFMTRGADGEERAFLVKRANTVEVRTDGNLAKLLKEKYESVMDSRYFGRGGIEVVLSGQIPAEEICDLVRLSYEMTRK